MDISLNICNNPQSVSKTQAKKSKSFQFQKLKKKNSSDNGFSFEFTKSDKVKAIVARKRPSLVKNNNNENNKIEKKVEKKTEKVKKSKPGRFLLAQPYAYSDSDDKDEIDNSKKLEENNEIHNEMNLELNVSKVINLSDVLKIKKQKLSRDERRQHKNAKYISNRSSDKVLTPEELKAGLKKFSEIPKSTVVKSKESKSSKENKTKPTVKSVDLFTDNPETKILGQRSVKPIFEKVFTGASISSLDLHPHCVKNLADILNITELTKVQQMTIPRALEGRDCVVRSQTGSGKTLAYALPIVQKLQEVQPKLTRNCGINALIIVPTRELVIQTYELFLKLLKPFTWLVPGMLTGGEKRKAEKARLRKGITILIGTPGRLCDHLLHTESFKLDKIKFLALDEADRLLELGYERDVKRIVEAIKEHKAGNFIKPSVTDDSENKMNEDQIKSSEQKKISNSLRDYQTLLLSATLTAAVQKLAGLTLTNPLFIDTSDEDSCINSDMVLTKNYEEAVDEAKLVIPETVHLSYVVVPSKLRLVTLSGLLAKEYKNHQKKFKVLIFMSTMEMVNFHNDLLNEELTNKVLDEEDEPNNEDENDEEPLLDGLRFFKLHGSMTQQERSGVFKAFREIKSGVLLTTDVAGRGIDVPEVDLVIQYSPPQKIPEFVHRVGRTGRAGRYGRAVLFLSPNETEFVRILESKRIRIAQGNMEPYLEMLLSADNSANTVQEAASNLQHKFEELILEDDEMHDKACKAFVSWVRFYSAFPKDLKHIFNIKSAHIGHFAKSFGLREAPKSFAKNHTAPKPLPATNRLTYLDRNLDKKKSLDNHKNRQQMADVANGTRLSNNFKRMLAKSVALSTSEYDSGMPATKKKRRM